MLDQKSSYLTILIATHNRLMLLKRTVNSIISGTKSSHEIIIIDGGSTDGTVEYLKKNKQITSVFQGKLLGASKAYNQIWRQINTKYTVCLSSDTEIVEGSLDLACDILDKHKEIGMVGLKMKETVGPWKSWPYKTGISEYGIVNCNHGVVRMDLLRAVGYFNEDYRSYTVDPDLTASVLCAGKQIVMTKTVSILHHREWAKNLSKEEVKEATKKQMGGIDNKKIYHKKFKFLKSSNNTIDKLKTNLLERLVNIFLPKDDSVIRGISRLDCTVLIKGRFIRITDLLEDVYNPYYLRQTIPQKLLKNKDNPYINLL